MASGKKEGEECMESGRREMREGEQSAVVGNQKKYQRKGAAVCKRELDSKGEKVRGSSVIRGVPHVRGKKESDGRGGGKQEVGLGVKTLTIQNPGDEMKMPKREARNCGTSNRHLYTKKKGEGT